MKVLIIEASYPKDFFSERLDGNVTQQLTKLLKVESRLVFALDRKHFKKAIKLAAEERYDVVHISCHGGDDGIDLTAEKGIEWPEFVRIFKTNRYSPEALVMSACCGAADELAEEFQKVESRPKIIFGSTDERYYNEYALAWAILYNFFNEHGIRRSTAQKALKAICATVHQSFRYLRWDDDKTQYMRYPMRGRRYEIAEVESS